MNELHAEYLSVEQSCKI